MQIKTASTTYSFFFFWFTFFEFRKVALINMIAILMFSANLDTPDILKIKLFLNKVYDVIYYVHDVTNKIFTRGNYIVDTIM